MTAMILPDVQATRSEVAINLSRVGVTNVKKLVKVARPGKRPIILISTFNMYVDLPSERRGANLSRNFEVIDEVLEEMVRSPVYEIEDLCGEVARRLLKRHEYATRSEVHMDSELIVKRKTPQTGMASQKVVKVFAKAVANRLISSEYEETILLKLFEASQNKEEWYPLVIDQKKMKESLDVLLQQNLIKAIEKEKAFFYALTEKGKAILEFNNDAIKKNVNGHYTLNAGEHIVNIKKIIGAEVIGITACPCAQEIMRASAEEEMRKLQIPQDKIDAFLGKIPMATHNQRGRGIVSVETAGSYDVPLNTIISIIERSMSTMSFELLKRGDEYQVVKNAHENPKFVEDCVRDMAKHVVEDFKNLPDDAIIKIKQINEESIHQHNAFAELSTTMGQLRAEIGSS